MQVTPRVLRRVLIGLLLLSSVSAAAGGIALIAGNGVKLPVASLSRSAFSSYAVPGLILSVVVGGTQAMGAALLLLRNKHAPLAAAVAGFGLIIWIYSEIYITQIVSWLQTLYFGIGIAELVLTLLLLGVILSVLKKE